MMQTSIRMRAQGKPQRVFRTLAVAGVILGCAGAFAVPAGAASDACCVVAAIDTGASLVTAREKAMGRAFQFKANNPQLLQSIRVGQDVYANYSRRVVSLDGSSICCRMVKLQSLAAATNPPESAAPAAARAVRAIVASEPGNTSSSTTANSGKAATTSQNSSSAAAKKTNPDAEKIKQKIKKGLGGFKFP